MKTSKTADARLTLHTARVSWTRTAPGGSKQKVIRDLQFRIDGRDGGWMVDRWTMPWESIHGCKPRRSASGCSDTASMAASLNCPKASSTVIVRPVAIA